MDGGWDLVAGSTVGLRILSAVHSNITLSRIHFSHGNAANDNKNGGAIYIIAYRNYVTIHDCVISDSYGKVGGGLYAVAQTSEFHVIGCTFSRNRALQGGGVYAQGYKKLWFHNCTITSNLATDILNDDTLSTAGYGGGVYVDWGQPSFKGVTIAYNNATKYGGGVLIANANADLEQCKIFYNRNFYIGGAGVAAFRNQKFRIMSTRFEGNISPEGGVDVRIMSRSSHEKSTERPLLIDNIYDEAKSKNIWRFSIL